MKRLLMLFSMCAVFGLSTAVTAQDKAPAATTPAATAPAAATAASAAAPAAAEAPAATAAPAPVPNKGDVKSLENEAMKRGSDVGDLSTLPMHLADLGTDSFEQEMSLGLMESESDELKHINEAFERISDGSFGLCENCKKKIPRERLKAIPYTRLCVNCKMKEEGV